MQVQSTRKRVLRSCDEWLAVRTWCWRTILGDYDLAYALWLLASRWRNAGCGRCEHCASSSTACRWSDNESEGSEAQRSDAPTLSRGLRLPTSRTAAFWTRCRCAIVDWGRPASSALESSSRLVTNAETSLLVMVGPSIRQTFKLFCII